MSNVIHTVPSVVCFDSGDRAYLEWLVAHPSGFVINTRRQQDHGSGTIHRASCAHIRSMRNSDVPGGFTERGWIKYCGPDLQGSITHFAHVRRSPALSLIRCKACNAVPRDLHFELSAAESGAQPEVGAVSVIVNARERDPLLRTICLEYHGTSCTVCSVDMGMRYGSIGKGFMDVHEVPRPAWDTQGWEFDPRRDLVPVCPNCHAMMHRGRDVPLTTQELRKILLRMARSQSDVYSAEG